MSVPGTLPRIGIVGGGQLARMLLPAAARLDLDVVLLARADDAAVPGSPEVVVGEPDAEGLHALAARVDVITVEHELVDLDALRAIEVAGTSVRPGPATLAVAVDKLAQHVRLGAAGAPFAPWALVASSDEVEDFAAAHGWSLIAKRPRGGYDGRGVFGVSSRVEVLDVIDEVGGAVLLEPALPIEREIAVLVARRPGGDLVVYDPVETVQADGMCREVLLPAPITAVLRTQARELAAMIAETIEVVGVLSVELFVVAGELLVNELAARPHNAGHPTIEGSVTSQFENHLRAVADLPLGRPDTRHASAMVNVVGAGADPRSRLAGALAVDDAHVHLYGKAYRDGRKLGHVTVVADDLGLARQRANLAAAALMPGHGPAAVAPTDREGR
ncbi:MAG: 5-(carboxyamino)imidazole ribonucleotide synthase [Nitriliruptoraceae bacterium]|nr:5-(carboxyamino)imidazole ribonucleotide synthase [Nitriliruptoraceae bacterium]